MPWACWTWQRRHCRMVAAAGTPGTAWPGCSGSRYFGRLAGYEDVNDAERLAHDPAMRADRRP